MKENSIYGSLKTENPYDVPYRPQASSNANNDWMCDMASIVEKFRTLEQKDIDHELTKHIPGVPLFNDNEVYSTCAIISNAATLRNSNLGHFIGERRLIELQSISNPEITPWPSVKILLI